MEFIANTFYKKNQNEPNKDKTRKSSKPIMHLPFAHDPETMKMIENMIIKDIISQPCTIETLLVLENKFNDIITINGCGEQNKMIVIGYEFEIECNTEYGSPIKYSIKYLINGQTYKLYWWQ